MSRTARIRLALALLPPLLASCGHPDEASRVVAEVAGVELTVAQLAAGVPQAACHEDSVVLADEFTREWVYRQVLLQQAEKSLAQEQERIDRAVEEYRQSLVVETYQKRLVEQKFNPSISRKDIEEYYAQSRGNFLLRDPIVKGIFAQVPDSAPDLPGLAKALTTTNGESSLEVEQYLYKCATAHRLFVDTWISLSQVRALFPQGTLADDYKTLRQSRLTRVDHAGSTYLLKLTDGMPAGELAPIEHVSQDIYNILLSRRKLDFLREANRGLYEQAMADNQIKFYD